MKGRRGEHYTMRTIGKHVLYRGSLNLLVIHSPSSDDVTRKPAPPFFSSGGKKMYWEESRKLTKDDSQAPYRLLSSIHCGMIYFWLVFEWKLIEIVETRGRKGEVWWEECVSHLSSSSNTTEGFTFVTVQGLRWGFFLGEQRFDVISIGIWIIVIWNSLEPVETDKVRKKFWIMLISCTVGNINLKAVEVWKSLRWFCKKQVNAGGKDRDLRVYCIIMHG